MTKRININYIKEFAESKNGKLLSKEYKNNSSRIRFKCRNCNFEWNTIWKSVSKGSWCPNCCKKLTSRRKMIVFISGHLDLTEEEFEKHYVSHIKKHIANNDDFIVGDAKGCDLMAQDYLAKHITDSDKVYIYHMHGKPRNNPNNFSEEGGFKSDTGRDSTMTDDSDIDIARVRPGREKSGTVKNLARRK